jgi:hypothetical protein
MWIPAHTNLQMRNHHYKKEQLKIIGLSGSQRQQRKKKVMNGWHPESEWKK